MLTRSRGLSLLAAAALLVFVATLSQAGILGPTPTQLSTCGGRETTTPHGQIKCVGLPTIYYCWKTGSPAPHLADHPPNDRPCTDAERAASKMFNKASPAP